MTTMTDPQPQLQPQPQDENPSSSNSASSSSSIALYESIRSKALEICIEDPILKCLLDQTVLSPSVQNLEDAVAHTIGHRLAQLTSGGGGRSGTSSEVCPHAVKRLLREGFRSPVLELGHTMSEAVTTDLVEIVRRDPACESPLEVLLFYKGFAALVCHRAAYRRPHGGGGGGGRYVGLWLQSLAAAAFGVDIHPRARVGRGVMLDHGDGVVVGETSVIGDGCTLLHGVTLGGTGKEGGDRHPKLGRDVLIGANATVLGNIVVGHGAKIGAGSVVLKPIPSGATAVGSPARIIGWTREKRPGSTVDTQLRGVHPMKTNATSATVDTNGTHAVTVKDSHNEHATTITTTNNTTELVNEEEKDDYLCPFKEMIKNIPTISDGSSSSSSSPMTLLRAILHQEGCSEAEIGEVYFALLQQQQQQPTALLSSLPRVCHECFVDVAQRYTTIQEPRCQEIAQLLQHFFRATTDPKSTTTTTTKSTAVTNRRQQQQQQARL